MADVLFIFDYRGTLTTLNDIEGYLRNLRAVHPACQISIFTGCSASEIPVGVQQAVDHLWFKPQSLWFSVAEINPRHLVYVDDEYLSRRAAWRGFHNRGYSFQVLGPEGLKELLTE